MLAVSDRNLKFPVNHNLYTCVQKSMRILGILSVWLERASRVDQSKDVGFLVRGAFLGRPNGVYVRAVDLPRECMHIRSRLRDTLSILIVECSLRC